MVQFVWNFFGRRRVKNDFKQLGVNDCAVSWYRRHTIASCVLSKQSGALKLPPNFLAVK